MSEPKKAISEQTGSKLTGTDVEGPPKLAESSGKEQLDNVLENEIGNFGRYQQQNFLVCTILIVFIAIAGNNYVFTTALIPTRCLIPECESKPAVFSPPWVNNAIPPGQTKDTVSYCERYGPSSTAAATVPKGTCPPKLFDRKKLVSCDTYVHMNKHTVVYDFGLACKEWRRTFIGMMRRSGTLTSLPLTSYISDKYGRRIAITFNAVNTAWLGTIRYWITSYNSFTALEFIESTFGAGLFSSVYVLVLEMISSQYRVAAGILMSVAFACGTIILGILAWLVPHWRALTLACYIPQWSAIVSCCLLGQSVRWLMSKGRFEEYEGVLKKMARMNGTSVSDSSLAGLRCTTQEQLEQDRSTSSSQGEGNRGLFVQVWQHKRVLARVIVTPFFWITSNLIYYGLGINAVNMSGNRYFNYIAVAFVELPGLALLYLLLDRIGRKPVLAGGFLICSACQFAYIIMPNDWFLVPLAVTMLAKCMIAMVYTSVYVYTSELYPTSNRHKLLAISITCGRVGSIAASLTPAFSQWFHNLPFVIFGSMALLSGMLITILPETLGTVLPSTFKEAEELGRAKNEQILMT